MTAETDVVSAGSAHVTIAFIYTLAAGMSNGEIRISVPAGWTAPGGSTSGGYVRSSRGFSGVSPGTRDLTITGVTGAPGDTVTIWYGDKSGGGPGATAPTSYGPQTWTAQQKSNNFGSVTALASSPVITVKAKDGSGTLAASKASVKHSSTANTIAFTFTAAPGGMAGGSFTFTVPKGWSLPSATASSPGYVTTSAGTLSISSRTILVSSLTLGAGATVTVTYGARTGGGPGAKATSVIGTQAWKAKEVSTPFTFSLSKALAASPKIKVT
jgi:hypothetical protein